MKMLKIIEDVGFEPKIVEDSDPPVAENEKADKQDAEEEKQD